MEAVHGGGQGKEIDIVFAGGECRYENIVVETAVVPYSYLTVRLGQGSETAILTEAAVLANHRFVTGLEAFAYLATVLRMVLYFRPLKVFMPLSGLVVTGGILKSILSFRLTGSMQESDVVILTAGFMTCMLGLLAEIIVAHHRR